MKYGVGDIVKMEEIDHIRKNMGMFIGNSETPTRLLEECLDNALDEVQAGYANTIIVSINTINNTFQVIDNGRGFPFDGNLDASEDAPVIACTQLFTSGKFDKSKKDSAYKISSGLHGIGLVACFALSETMVLDSYRDNLHAKYIFTSHDKRELYKREIEKLDKKSKIATSILVKPAKEYFDTLDLDLESIIERLKIANVEYGNKLKVYIKIDDKTKLIETSETEMVEEYLTGNDIKLWNVMINKKPESCRILFGWDHSGPAATKHLSIVNLVKTSYGVHVKKFKNVVMDVLGAFARSNNIEFNRDDPISHLRFYINLKLIKTSFEAQVKVKLESKTDLSIMDALEKELKRIVNDNKDEFLEIVKNIQEYRRSIDAKKIGGRPTTNAKKRGSFEFTKLMDCIDRDGELIITEGDSAANGLKIERDRRKHAILPLKGVIPNVTNTTKSKLLNNVELRDMNNAIGTGIWDECDISKIRYGGGIIIAADADPAGKFITVLLLAAIAYFMKEVIEGGYLYICETPLWADVTTEFVPLWSEEEIKEARNNPNKKTKRFKGLGEFSNEQLNDVILNRRKRRLINVEWCGEKYLDRLFGLLRSSAEKKKLVMGEWSLEEEI